jgi:hypothetical protein
VRAGARIKRIEKKVYDGKNIILADILKGLSQDKAHDSLCQLLSERLPHRGPVSLTGVPIATEKKLTIFVQDS